VRAVKFCELEVGQMFVFGDELFVLEMETETKFRVARDERLEAVIFDEDEVVFVDDDVVNHPSHYSYGSIEVIDFIEDKELGFHLGNAIKYICRAGRKDKSKEIEDLRKAVWYIERYIKCLE
jgi:hypothetical protein